MCLGGSGRFLIFHFKSLKKLAIFDVCELKIAGDVAVKDDGIFYAAGTSQLLVVHPDMAAMECYALDTLKLQTTRTLPLQGRIKVVAVGSASDGPLLISAVDNVGRPPITALLDLQTLKPLDDKWQHFASASQGQFSRARASGRGNVFAWATDDRGAQGRQLLICEGLNVKAAFLRGGNRSDDVCPDESGERIYFTGQMVDRQLRTVELPRGQIGAAIRYPRHTGRCMCGCRVTITPNRPQLHLKSTISVCLPGESSPLTTFDDVLFRPYNGADYKRYTSLPVADQVLLIPGAHVLAIVQETKDRVVLRRFDLDRALQAWGKEYLFTMSTPPRYVRAGEDFEYRIDAKSSKPPIKYRLDSGPEGMTLSPEGLMRWPVRPAPKGVATVIVSVEDASGKSVFHTFDLVVRSDGYAARAEVAALQAPAVTYRTFRDVSGRYKVEAAFQLLVDEKVKLKRKDGGGIVSVPLEKLSLEDRQWIREHPAGPVSPASADKTRPDASGTASARPAASGWIGQSLALDHGGQRMSGKARSPGDTNNSASRA